MSTIQGNLAAVAKEVDGAHRKASKLSGGKSSANKVANATSDVESANQQWESQAPYVFEQLQSLDETRINHLRDVLTQLETHEVDLVERNRITAESCLNALLNIETSEEISTFVAKVSGGDSSTMIEPPRLGSRGGTSGQPPIAASTPTPPVPRLPSSSTTPSRNREDSAEIPSPFSTASRATTGKFLTAIPLLSFSLFTCHSALRSYSYLFNDILVGPPLKSGFGGLRRLGTVLGGRSGKGGKGMERPPSPEKRSRPTRNPLRRGPNSRQDMQTIPSPPMSSTHLPSSPPRREPPLSKISSQQSNEQVQPRGERRQRENLSNGDAIQEAPIRGSSMPMTNGESGNRDLNTAQKGEFAPPPGPPPGKAPTEEVM